MTLPKVYLSGPMAGLTYDQGTEWRVYATKQLRDVANCLSPYRGKDYLKGQTVENKEYAQPMSTSKAITSRDMWDTHNSDVVLVNLTDHSKFSIGTIMEIAWAYDARVPVIAVIPKESDYFNHPILSQCCTCVVQDLDEAIEIVKVLLNV
jgi:nucleoside 2-deoxyribosyltransferase